jgi:hypothetical protein
MAAELLLLSFARASLVLGRSSQSRPQLPTVSSRLPAHKLFEVQVDRPLHEDVVRFSDREVVEEGDLGGKLEGGRWQRAGGGAACR